MDDNAITAAIHTWAAQYGSTANIDDAVTASTRTVSETAASLTTERLCVLAAYTDTWHVFCFVERVVWAVDNVGDAKTVAALTFETVLEK